MRSNFNWSTFRIDSETTKAPKLGVSKYSVDVTTNLKEILRRARELYPSYFIKR
ncbi:MAG: hypothetical protein PHE25_02975 [Candidatus Gracilibacteria bacterium]|nr:hypothetical protein [Candidatus Gracilibacteria bacterium]